MIRYWRAALALLALGVAAGVPAHEVPADVAVQLLVRPEGARLKLLVRAPLEAMRDVTFPLRGPGYLDIDVADGALRDAAELWLAGSIELYEGERRVEPFAIAAVRASIPSDRSFAAFDSALEHVRAPPLPAGTELFWQQALLDVELEAPIASAASRFSIRPRLERLGQRVVTAVRFLPPSGIERVYRIDGDAGVVPLDPRWYQSMLRFLVQGFAHILDGLDHLLFLLCLVVPFRNDLRALVGIVTAFTVGHSVTLIGSVYGAAPDALWFPPLVETLIAGSILYMAIENVVGPNGRVRWLIAGAFGLVHGFGFSFALSNTLQFAGSHVLTSLLAFNVGIELGQILVLIVLVPLLGALFRYAVAEKTGTILISVFVGHTAWHWLVERFEAFRSFRLGLADLAAGLGASGLPWLVGSVVLAAVVVIGVRRAPRVLQGREDGV